VCKYVVCVCVCLKEIERKMYSVCKRVRENVCMGMYVLEKKNVCVLCVCVCEREREREIVKGIGEKKREREECECT